MTCRSELIMTDRQHNSNILCKNGATDFTFKTSRGGLPQGGSSRILRHCPWGQAAGWLPASGHRPPPQAVVGAPARCTSCLLNTIPPGRGQLCAR